MHPTTTPVQHQDVSASLLTLPLAAPVVPSLLLPVPIPRPDLEELRQSLSFAFSSGVSGGLFSQALDRAPLAHSTWEPRSFAPDLFLEELVARCFRVRVSGHEAVVHRAFILRVISHPPSDPRVTELRRGILRELSESPTYRAQLEQLYAVCVRLRGALEGATVGKKLDPTRRQLDVLVLVKRIFDHMGASFEGAQSGLSRLRESAPRCARPRATARWPICSTTTSTSRLWACRSGLAPTGGSEDST